VPGNRDFTFPGLYGPRKKSKCNRSNDAGYNADSLVCDGKD